MQRELQFHGGFREGAGRKRIRSKGVAHGVREKVTHRTALHVNFKYKIPVRNKDTLKILKHAIKNARTHGLRILQYSFQHNHIHLIVEADNNETLSRGMRSLTITFAKRLKKGRIQLERYHLHVLRSFREVKHAVHYVLFNEQKHDSGICSTVGPYSSLLSMQNCMDFIRKFAAKKRIALKIEKSQFWRGDDSRSYIYRRGIEEMLS